MDKNLILFAAEIFAAALFSIAMLLLFLRLKDRKSPLAILSLIVASVSLLVGIARAQTVAQYVASPNANYYQEIALTDVNSNYTDAPTNVWQIAAGTNLILGGTYTNPPLQQFQIRPGFGVTLRVGLTNTTAKHCTFYFNFDQDGNVTPSDTNFTWQVTQNGTGTNWYETNLPWATLDGFKTIQMIAATNDATGPAQANIVQFQYARAIPWNPSPRGY